MNLPVMNGKHVYRCTLRERMAGVRQAIKDSWGGAIADETVIAKGPPLVATVNWNRWLVECPDCHSAEYLWPDEPLFMCTNCFNGTVGGAWRRVTVPAERDEIERALAARPVPNSRNWQPGETVADLRSENLAHALPEEVG